MRASLPLAVAGLFPYWLLALNMLGFDDPARVAWFVVGTLAATLLALLGLARRSPFAIAASTATLLAIGFPLTISATLFVAVLPAALVAAAARVERLAPTPPTIGVGIASAAAALLLAAMAIRNGSGIPRAAILVSLAYPIQLVAVAILCAWPRRRAGTAKRDAPHRAA